VSEGLIYDLVGPDPWQHSREGSDDCCHFCGSEDYALHSSPPYVNYTHENDCAWVRAIDHLKLPRPGHGTRAERSV
jgi:hypothetical protein